MAAQRATALLYLLPHRHRPECRPSCAGGWQLAVDHLQALPRADHTRGRREMVLHHAQARPVGKHFQLLCNQAPRVDKRGGLQAAARPIRMPTLKNCEEWRCEG